MGYPGRCVTYLQWSFEGGRTVSQALDAVADGNDVWVQISRGEADRLGLAPGSEIFLRPVLLRPVTARQPVRCLLPKSVIKRL